MTFDADRSADTTAAVMRDTAEALEETEAMLHRSAEESPSAASADRLHRIADDVTAEANRIAGRADRLVDHSPASAEGSSARR